MMKIYVSGKISGLEPKEVRDKFEKAGAELRAWGFEPVLPVDNICQSDDWGEQMIECFSKLNKCSGIYLLNDWGSSEGAIIERRFAMRVGKFVMAENSSLENLIKK